MDKTTRLGMYRILRKLGVSRDEIRPDASFETDLFFDEKDWLCFHFFVESKFNISIEEEELMQLTNLESSISTVNRHLALN